MSSVFLLSLHVPPSNASPSGARWPGIARLATLFMPPTDSSHIGMIIASFF
jgi:hypothetical protein